MYEIGLIFGSHNYRKNFIIDYFKNRQCEEKEINSTPYSFYQYSCDNENQFSDFPNLSFGVEGKYSLRKMRLTLESFFDPVQKYE